MRNLLNKKLKNEKGLTLIELLAVIVILAIIALIAIPAIGSIVSNSKSKAILSDATSIIAGAKTAITDGACSPDKDKDDKETGNVTCSKTQLADFVENVKQTDDTTYSVTKAKDGDYSITYSELANLNKKYADKVFGAGKTSTTATQKQIAKAMGNKPEEPANP
ncbi:prepilin-type N-terminal cleavage/methylation domain-containing protein [Kurthia sp. YJT4]|uniref:prepilin-type N-terminal cleavage/methylation domain-containing protein n=1 Tax=Kurthia sp. YJT4 TaxID=3049086 RepID=UPI00255090DE|nr:prepilin-type N-terminal cleavage/methylation domain-containing protein [Kurthia sp. YJT4]WIL37641.1 prepilin-type N-terminal cleavage/methylation domain-containing protein [Kurthia sp. YJT4]